MATVGFLTIDCLHNEFSAILFQDVVLLIIFVFMKVDLKRNKLLTDSLLVYFIIPNFYS